MKDMTNKELAALIWKKAGIPLGYTFAATTMVYFVLMGFTTTGITGPASIGWYLLGNRTYIAANNLFYFGSAIMGFRLGVWLFLKAIEFDYKDTDK